MLLCKFTNKFYCIRLLAPLVLVCLSSSPRLDHVSVDSVELIEKKDIPGVPKKKYPDLVDPSDKNIA